MAAGPYGFEMWARYVGPTILSGPKEIVNDAQRGNFGTLSYVLRGQLMSDILKHGTSLQDTVLLSAAPASQTYRPGQDKVTYEDPQHGVEWVSNWRYIITKMIVRDQELAKAGSTMTADARFLVYKDVLFSKKQAVFTDFFDFMEDRYWAQPNKLLMEGSTALTQEPYSLPCAINEHTNGLFPSYTPGGAWTTFQGIDPTAYSNWKPQVFTYGATASSGFAAHNVENVIGTLDGAMPYLKISPPPIMKEYFEPDAMATAPRPFIGMSPKGVQKFKTLYRSENDKWDNASDPWGNITYNGMSLLAILHLATAKLYANAAGNALVDEDNADKTGPRAYIINPRYWRSVFHSEHYLDLVSVSRSPDDPEAQVYPWRTWTQNVCRSRRRQALLTPGNDY